MKTATKKLPNIPNVLTIAGSDSGGGAGIQADIKAMSANGVYAASVITAITAQNTLGVNAIHNVPVDIIEAQIDAVLSDIDCVAVKIGMLSKKTVIQLVSKKIKQYDLQTVVLDPVMVATSGDQLLAEVAIDTLKKELIPKATIITPNIIEAGILSGLAPATNQTEMVACAEKLILLGAKAVLLKGGHLDGDQSSDLLLNTDGDVTWLSSTRIATNNTHGTGCTLSSALCAFLAQGQPLTVATKLAKEYIQSAIQAANQLQVGCGSGPVNHFAGLK